MFLKSQRCNWLVMYVAYMSRTTALIGNVNLVLVQANLQVVNIGYRSLTPNWQFSILWLWSCLDCNLTMLIWDSVLVKQMVAVLWYTTSYHEGLPKGFNMRVIRGFYTRIWHTDIRGYTNHGLPNKMKSCFWWLSTAILGDFSPSNSRVLVV